MNGSVLVGGGVCSMSTQLTRHCNMFSNWMEFLIILANLHRDNIIMLTDKEIPGKEHRSSHLHQMDGVIHEE